MTARCSASPRPTPTSPPRPEARGQRGDHAAAAAAGQGRARHRQDHARASRWRARSACRCSSGTSSRPPRRSRASTSTTRSRGCAIRSSATRACTTSPTTSSAACCGRRSRPTRRSVLLIDEIDKADIEFPNDLLRELDRMEFYVYETQRAGAGAGTGRSSSSPEQREGAARRVPAPLLLPLHPLPRPRDDGAHRRRALSRHQEASCCARRWRLFFEVREVPGLKKKPSTSELLDWLKLLLAEDIPPEALRSQGPEQDHPAAARRAAEERAGRAPVRAAGVHVARPDERTSH